MFLRTSAGRLNRRAATLGALFAVAAVVAACGHHQTGTAAPAPPPSATHASMSPPAALDPQLRTSVEQQVATRMHLDAAQIRDQLHADPHATLMTLAKPLGLAQDKLAAIILDTLRDSADAAIRSGTWTARQANQEKQFWTVQAAPDLIAEISNWFRES